VCAAFRPEVIEAAYEAPAVLERTPVDTPLIGLTSGGGASAAFRPEVIEAAYEAPAIAERTPLESPLIGAFGSPAGV